ncbi:MAG: serine hydrolase domain-containing protein [Kofleriaceae bacterium]
MIVERPALRAVVAVLAALLNGCGARSEIAQPPAAERALRQQLEAIRGGAAGVELAGIAVSAIAADGSQRSAAVGCALFAEDGRRCQRELSADTLLRVASISKLVTAIATVKLATAGKLDLDADSSELLAPALGRSLRNPRFADHAITARQLLAHTSSLRDGSVYSLPPPATLAQLLDQPDRFDGAHPPGAYFHYANINYVVLGAAIERVTGERFDVALQREVLTPAGVVAGYGWGSVGPLAARRWGALYRRRGPDDDAWEPRGPWRAQVDALPLRAEPLPNAPPGAAPQFFSPHGGLRISAVDLARLLRAAVQDAPDRPALLSATARAALFDTAPLATVGDYDDGFYRDYALGNHAFAVNGHPVRAHFGDAYGLKGGVLFDPSSGEVWVYRITGYAAPPPAPAGAATRAGLDVAEAAVLRALWASAPPRR